MSMTTFNEMVTSGAGGILLLLPNPDAIQKLSDAVRESIKSLQEHLYTTEFEIPIYFATESEELLDLLNNLGGDTGVNDKKPSGLDGKDFVLVYIKMSSKLAKVSPICLGYIFYSKMLLNLDEIMDQYMKTL